MPENTINNPHKFLPANYRQIISEKLGCHPNMVSLVSRAIRENDKVILTSPLQISIAREIYRIATEQYKKNRAIKGDFEGIQVAG